MASFSSGRCHPPNGIKHVYNIHLTARQVIGHGGDDTKRGCNGNNPDNPAAGASNPEVAALLALSEEEKVELGKAVLSAVRRHEASKGRTTSGQHGDDYTKSLGGTKQDTQVRECQIGHDSTKR